LVATRNAVDMSPGVVVVSKVEKSVSRQLCSGRGAGPASRTSCSASRAVAAVCAGLQSPSHEDASRSPGLDLPFDDSSSATGAVLCLGTRYGEGVASAKRPRLRKARVATCDSRLGTVRRPSATRPINDECGSALCGLSCGHILGAALQRFVEGVVVALD
jgi:hypothetical protein